MHQYHYKNHKNGLEYWITSDNIDDADRETKRNPETSCAQCEHGVDMFRSCAECDMKESDLIEIYFCEP